MQRYARRLAKSRAGIGVTIALHAAEPVFENIAPSGIGIVVVVRPVKLNGQERTIRRRSLEDQVVEFRCREVREEILWDMLIGFLADDRAKPNFAPDLIGRRREAIFKDRFDIALTLRLRKAFQLHRDSTDQEVRLTFAHERPAQRRLRAGPSLKPGRSMRWLAII